MSSLFHSPNGNSPRHAYKGKYRKGSPLYKATTKTIKFKADPNSMGKAIAKGGGHRGVTTKYDLKKAGIRRVHSAPTRGVGRASRGRSRASTAATFSPAIAAGGLLTYRGGRKVVRTIKARRAGRGGGGGVHRDRRGRFA